MESLRGHLLIAGPSLFDENFRRAVVLIGEHTDEGALGVVLNRPSSLTVEEAAPALAPLVPAGATVFYGGPVQPQAAVVLAEFEQPDMADLLVFGSVGFLTGDIPAEALAGIRRARVFAGYAGWGPGQLERELEEDSWIRVDAFVDDVFANEPGEIWPRVVRRKGEDFAVLATMPFDPSMN